MNALKFQLLALLNGLIRNLYGPVEGRRHNAGPLKDSGLLNILERLAYSPAGNVLCIYGDPAYRLRPHLMARYSVGEIVKFTPKMQAFNETMRSVRVSVTLNGCLMTF